MLRYNIKTGVTKVKTKLAIAVTSLALIGGGAGLSLGVFGTAHASPPPSWNLNGTYHIDFFYGSTYTHDATITGEDSAGNFSISGGYPVGGPYAYAWSGTGNTAGSNVTVSVNYTTGAPGTHMDMTGTIASNGTMSGSWSDNFGGTRNGTWATSLGTAIPSTLYVSNNPTATGLGSCLHPNYNTIQGAVNAAYSGDVIHVCAGTYPENVTINPPVTLLGNNAGISGTSGSRVAESVITGIVTVNDPNVTIDGFTVDGQNTRAYGVEINPAASDMVLTNNIIENFNSASDTAQAVYLVHGPDGTKITRNSIHDVHGVNSTKGVFIGDSNTTDPSNNVVIRNNAIYNVTSDSKGAYAITINNGSNPVGTTHNTGLVIRNNNISNLTGGWVHAIGLEADTPGAVVRHNTIEGLNAASPDNIGVWLENTDPSHASVKVNRNNFLFTNAFGIAVHPSFTSGTLDGTCNYWDSNTGPSGVGSGSGAPVTSLVSYQPWLIAKNGDCVGGTKPKSKNDCKDNGWQYLVNENNSFFKNQGQCVSWVEHNVLHHGDKDKDHDHDEDVFWRGHHFFF